MHIGTVSLELAQPPNSLLAVLKRLPQAITLAFVNCWFADDFGNLAQGGSLIPKEAFWINQRVVLILAFIGLCWALRDVRSWAYTLAALLSLVMVGLSWFEPTHNMPLLPALCLFVGLFVCEGLSGFRKPVMWRSPVSWLGASLIVAAFAMLALSPVDPPTLVVDVLPPPLLVLGGGLLFIAGAGAAAKHTPGRFAVSATLFCGLLPSAIFLLGYFSYVSVSDAPGYRYRHVNITTDKRFIQAITMATPLQIDSGAKAYILLDLRSPFDQPPLNIELNGTAVTTAEQWRHLYPVDMTWNENRRMEARSAILFTSGTTIDLAVP